MWSTKVLLQHSSSFHIAITAKRKRKKNNKNKIIKNGDKHFHLHGTFFRR